MSILGLFSKTPRGALGRSSLSRLSLLALLVVCAFGALSGCKGIRKRSQLFRTIHEEYYKKQNKKGLPVIKLKETDPASYVYRFEPYDSVQIEVLNLPQMLLEGLLVGDGAGISGMYQVDGQGYIDLPLMGSVLAAGRTNEEMTEAVRSRLSMYYNNPIVRVNSASMKVYLFGDVAKEGIQRLQNDRTHLVEVLARAGGASRSAKNQKIKIIRGDWADPQIIWVDLSTDQSLDDPSLIMQDDDIVYIESRFIFLLSREIAPYSALITILTVLPSLVFLFRQL